MSHDEPDRGMDPADELVALREDNARLRALLGLDRRAEGGHASAWVPTLSLFDPPRANPIDATATDGEKIRLLRSLFAARADVYATRWENDDGRSGWAPVSKGGKSKGRTRHDHLPLSDGALRAHLRGGLTVGVYALMRGDTCGFLACDFDKGSWALDSLAYLDVCHANDVPAVLERSRSGNGAHVWVFFDGPVSATPARQMGAGLLRRAMATRVELDLASYDRLFPAQDYLPKAGFGNLIALPIQGDCAQHGTTVFLDPTTMAPWSDQWAFLSSVATMTADAVKSMAAALRPVQAGPALSFSELASAEGPAAPEVITARLGATLAVERAGLPPGVVAALKHQASISNPQFHEKQRLRFSTWDTPRYISAYREDLEWLHLPRGLAQQVEASLGEVGSTLDITDDRPNPPALDVTFTGSLRDQQSAAVRRLVDHDLGMFVAPPGAGKTVVACALIAHRRSPTLVIVDRKELLEQWRTRLLENLDLEANQIGQIGGGRDRRTHLIDVAMIQSLARRTDNALFDAYGFVIVDECHHLPAVSFTECVQRARSRRWLGLTATPYRRDGLEPLIAFQCGPVRHEIKATAVEGAELMRRELVVHPTNTVVTDDEAEHIHDVFAALVDDHHRTAQICADVSEAFHAGRTCLVLTQRVAHIDHLVDGLNELEVDALVLRGGLGKRARADVTRRIEDRDQKAGLVLVATGSYLGEGFDWPELDTLFLAFPLAFKGRVVQYVGRLLRVHDHKHRVELHDYVDEHIPVLDRMHGKRHSAYRTLGFEVPRRPKRRRSVREPTGDSFDAF